MDKNTSKKTSLSVLERFLNYLKRERKPPAWKCHCGHVIVKRGAKLSGCDSYDHGIHVHCPKCNRIVERFIDPKKVEIYAEGIRYVG